MTNRLAFTAVGCLILAFFVGERIIIGNYVQDMFHDFYIFYEVVFLGSFFGSLLILKSFRQKFVLRLFLVPISAYVTSFASYHLTSLVKNGLSSWLAMFKEHQILLVFAPSSLAAIVVSIFFIAFYDGLRVTFKYLVKVKNA